MNSFLHFVIRLLSSKRQANEINSVSHEWHEYYPEEFIKKEDIYGKKSIFPVHGLLNLKSQLDRDTKRKLHQHCTELRNM